MKHGSLFSGIGGFDLAAEWMGWENVFHCEWNDYNKKILKQRFAKAESYGDIREFDARKYNGTIDVISGGFPCQDISIAQNQGGGQKELKGKGLDCGKNTPVLYGKLDPSTLSLKTVQCLLFEDLNTSYATFPQWGMMRNGECFMLRNLDSTTEENEYMELPTPSAADAKIILTKVESYRKYYRNEHQDKVLYQCHLNGLTAKATMEVYEWMMGFPKNWTKIESTPVEMP
jgi:hypothetical protein